MHRDYQRLIKESEEELKERERAKRYSHIGQRLRMLRLLKSGQCSSIQQVAVNLGYSWRHCQRWMSLYWQGGLEQLLRDKSVNCRVKPERMNAKAWEALNEAMARGEIASYKQARELLAEQGVHYRSESSIFRLFRRHKIKAKTGRYRHEQVDGKEQEDFKKTSADF